MKYIFLDTCALSLTEEHGEKIHHYLVANHLTLIITKLQLIEYYNPMRQDNDRIDSAIKLFTEIPFVIVSQDDIITKEEEEYPNILTNVPIRIDSKTTLKNHSLEEKKELLAQLFELGIPDAEYDIKKSSEDYNFLKTGWITDARKIIDIAKAQGIENSKIEFTQSLDLRFCENIVNSQNRLNSNQDIDPLIKKNRNKADLIRLNKDMWKMRGIHLSSLIFWYDYLVSKKAIKASDHGDFMHSMVFPYCSIVVTDKSRVDCIQKIQRNENLYNDIIVYNQKSFIKIIS